MWFCSAFVGYNDQARPARAGIEQKIINNADALVRLKRLVMPTLSFDTVVLAISKERERQDEKWGSLEVKQQSVAGYLLILEAEIAEAKAGWMKNIEGRHSALAEIVQIAAVAVACLQQHGVTGNPL